MSSHLLFGWCAVSTAGMEDADAEIAEERCSEKCEDDLSGDLPAPAVDEVVLEGSTAWKNTADRNA